MSPEAERNRLLDLLADRALEGLDADHEAELAALLDRTPVADVETYEAIVAELVVSSIRGVDEVPPELRQRLEGALARRTLESEPLAAPPAARPATPAGRTNIRWSELAGWLAAAVCVVALIAVRRDAPPPPAVPGPDPTAGERRTALLETADDAVQLAWAAGPTAPPREEGFDFGDVVWSPARQEGFLRIRGLPVNDPSREQYQLWIFDATRDKAHPVDGGVFDVDADGEVVVPIAAKLAVREATLFAITVEPPGGVVVSDRSRLPLLSKVPAT